MTRRFGQKYRESEFMSAISLSRFDACERVYFNIINNLLSVAFYKSLHPQKIAVVQYLRKNASVNRSR